MRSQMLATIVAVVLVLALDAHGQSARQLSSALECKIGPITKTYGGTKWLVYSCSDTHTLVVVSAPDSPASPFYFLLAPENDGYRLHGEGTGNKSATDAAYKELSALSEGDVVSLIAETKKH